MDSPTLFVNQKRRVSRMIITGKAIVVYAKKDDELYFFKIYDYPKQQDKIHEKFKKLFSDDL